MTLELIVIAPTVIIIVIALLAMLRESGYGFDLRRRVRTVLRDRRRAAPPSSVLTVEDIDHRNS